MMTSTGSYDELYLQDATNTLGEAFDWVVNTCGDNIQDFADRFSQSEIGHLFSIGTPKFVVGMTGAELANEVMIDRKLPPYNKAPVFHTDKSPEYWVGHILAGYQWYSGKTFKEIVGKIPMEDLLGLYHLGHEQDESKVFEILDGWTRKK